MLLALAAALVAGCGGDGEPERAQAATWEYGRAMSSRRSYIAAAQADSQIYVAGGIETPDAKAATKHFFALDLGAAEPAWKALEPWPASERMLSVAATHGK